MGYEHNGYQIFISSCRLDLRHKKTRTVSLSEQTEVTRRKE